MNIRQTFHVFVYGTLRKGFGNHRLLAHERFIGSGRTRKRLTMVDAAGGAFPAVVHAPGRSTIRGEVYAVTPETLDRLDCLEGCPRHYERAEYVIEIDRLARAPGIQQTRKIREVVCWMYFQRDVAGRPIIASGDWAQHSRALAR